MQGVVTLFTVLRFWAGTLFTPACNCSENMALGLAYLFYEPKRNDTRYGRSEKDQVLYLKPGGQSAGPNCPLVAPELATPEEKTFFVYYKQVLAHVSRYP
jgi:hypothetical protein